MNVFYVVLDLHLLIMLIQDTEDDSITRLQQLSVPVQSVITPDSPVKMMLQTVSEIILAQLIFSAIDTELSILDPVGEPACCAPEERIVSAIIT